MSLLLTIKQGKPSGRLRIPAFIFLALALVLAACSPQPTPADPGDLPPTGPQDIESYADVVAGLEAAGGNVEPAGTLEQPFFEVDASLITLNGQTVQIFEFADEATRQEASNRIAQDASTIGEVIPTWVDQPHFWATGRVIVLYVGTDEAVLALLNNVLGIPAAVGPITPTGEIPPQVILEAQRVLSEQLGVNVTEIQIVQFEQVDWPDACLGLPQPDEVCAQVITPGFRIVLQVEGQQHEVRTDLEGRQVRIQTPTQ
jgi:hypothetical protein